MEYCVHEKISIVLCPVLTGFSELACAVPNTSNQLWWLDLNAFSGICIHFWRTHWGTVSSWKGFNWVFFLVLETTWEVLCPVLKVASAMLCFLPGAISGVLVYISGYHIFRTTKTIWSMATDRHRNGAWETTSLLMKCSRIEMCTLGGSREGNNRDIQTPKENDCLF